MTDLRLIDKDKHATFIRTDAPLDIAVPFFNYLWNTKAIATAEDYMKELRKKGWTANEIEIVADYQLEL